MPPRTLLLLPPSEGKVSGGRRRAGRDRFAPRLAAERTAVLDGLARAVTRASDDELSRLLRVRGPLLERATVATRSLIDGDAPLLPAWQRYSGVVWEHLDPASLAPGDRSRILVPSALYGVTTAEDQIADYRLGMGVHLPGVGNLARFWRRSLADAVRTARGRSTVIDLLPAEHRGAIDSGTVGNVVKVSFRAIDGQGAAGHFAKAVKGRFARHLIDHGLGDALGFEDAAWAVRATDEGFELRSIA